MGQIPPLFANPDNANEALNEATFGVASFLRWMWESFHPYADPTFTKEMNEAVHQILKNPTPGPDRDQAFYRFHQRFWEMYVGCALLDQNVTLVPRSYWPRQSGGAGPDLLTETSGRRVWVECIAPGPGTGPDHVPDISDAEESEVPVEQIKLRLLSAIDTKRRQAAAHAKAGIIHSADGYVIAVNAHHVPFSCCDEEPPMIVRVLYGLGTQAVRFDLTTKTWSEPSLTLQRSITKRNTQSVGADLFAYGKAEEVSGVLYSRVHAWSRPPTLGIALKLVHNFTAKAPVPDRWLPFSVSYSMSVHGDVGTITRTDPSSTR